MTRHEIRAVPALLIAGLIGLAPVSAAAQTEIFRSMTNERCSEASRDAAANAARQNVESHVTRSEASIQPPTPVGDLSCLNDLMNIDIDFLSGELFSIGDIFGDLLSGLQNVTLEGLEGEVTRQICEFAAEKWSDLTEPLNLSLDDLTGSISPDFTSNFALINVAPSGTGSQAGGPVTPIPTTQSVPLQVPTTQDGTNVQDTINQIYNSINGGN
jgi:hypothetical protein